MDEMSVPPDLRVPAKIDGEFVRQVERVNRFLAFARGRMRAMEKETKRLSNVRGNVPIHNGPNGIVLL